MKVNMNAITKRSNVKMFDGEKLLVIVGCIGFLLAAICALYILNNGAIILPEGNVGSAFSFNAAIAVFVLSIAALLPLSGFSRRKRANLRWGFILTVLIGYGIETVQHFRGINPRFTQEGSIADMVLGGFFGLTSLILIVVTVLLAVSFFNGKKPIQRSPLYLGIRYAFISTMIAFAAGIFMVALQSRYTGLAGNFIMVHGLGFHALQAMPLLGWLTERTQKNEKRARYLIHIGGNAWMLSIMTLGIHTILGRSIFEWTPLPILAGSALVVWVICIGCLYKSLFHSPRNLLWTRDRS